MSCVRPPEMTRLDQVTGDEESDVRSGVALCCGFFSLCFTPEVTPPAEELETPEEQTTATSTNHPETAGLRTERRATFLEGLAEGIVASLSLPTSLQRISHGKPKELICCLLEPKSKAEPCPVCPIRLCLACDTLHSHPDYIYHCLLEHPIPPVLGKESVSQTLGHELDVQRSTSPITLTPSDLHLHALDLPIPESMQPHNPITPTCHPGVM
ncbi:uncharacterized protein C17orf50 homolog [Rhinoderma darwinii]|uniref:uncharacterized protein C17orf50 homolog n=1 Tax=Rhinoderma darwinii TaxID=43563 RepID=UPI003F679E4A